MEASIAWRSIQLAEQQHHLASHRDIVTLSCLARIESLCFRHTLACPLSSRNMKASFAVRVFRVCEARNLPKGATALAMTFKKFSREI